MEPRPEVFVWRKDHSNPVVRCKYSLRPEVFVRRRVVLRKGFCGGRVGRRGGGRGGRCEAACMGRQGVWARSQGEERKAAVGVNTGARGVGGVVLRRKGVVCVGVGRARWQRAARRLGGTGRFVLTRGQGRFGRAGVEKRRVGCCGERGGSGGEGRGGEVFWERQRCVGLGEKRRGRQEERVDSNRQQRVVCVEMSEGREEVARREDLERGDGEGAKRCRGRWDEGDFGRRRGKEGKTAWCPNGRKVGKDRR